MKGHSNMAIVAITLRFTKGCEIDSNFFEYIFMNRVQANASWLGMEQRISLERVSAEAILTNEWR